MSGRRRRRPRGSVSQESVVIEDSPITVDLCTNSATDASVGPSCIDLTRDDEEIVDLTSVNDSIVCLDAGPSSMHTRRQSTRQRRGTQLSSRARERSPKTIILDCSLSENQLTTVRDDETSPRKKIICPVCLDDEKVITQTSRHLVSTVCGHVFCNICIYEAIRSLHGCPNCRKKLTLKQFHQIFL